MENFNKVYIYLELNQYIYLYRFLVKTLFNKLYIVLSRCSMLVAV
jgi:hypothetical protein